MGPIVLMEAAMKAGIRMVQVSTDEVYGSLGESGRFTEDSPLAPNSPYSASKAAADCFARSFCETHKADIVVSRCSNNYGPHQHDEKMIPVILRHLQAGEKVPVYGDGKNVRDWIHVEDHAWGVFLALTKGRAGEVYNFGGHGELNNLELLRHFCGLTQRVFEESLRFVEDRKGHDRRYAIDPSKASRELGWAPVWSLAEGLAATARWYAKQ
jgi:dTDP-glucose 4,6-dehydratase